MKGRSWLSEARTCIGKAVELLGMGRRSLRRLPVDDGFAMDIAALTSTISHNTTLIEST